MGLRINQNIAALNAARNLRITDGAMSRSLERLSSGFRINRAADDPAGLIISENLRAQVAGLSQAVKNSNNAVNLIKTAEAALDEVLKQLRSIRTLALDALNTGASDAVARAADQTQITSSIESINRIANTTQFGKIKLLNGSSGVRGSTNSSNLQFVSGTTKTVAGTYNVDISQEATKGTTDFTIQNEYSTADDGAAAVIKLDTGDVAAFKVDFGIAAGLSASDISDIGANLKAAGLKDDTSVSGITVQLDETNATAFVFIDKDAGNFTADAVDTKLLEALNGSAIGKVLKFNEDVTTAEKLQVTGLVAGLDFRLQDVTVDNGTGGDTGLSSGEVLATADNAFVSNDGEIAGVVIDFGASTSLTASEKAALRTMLVNGGVKTETISDAGGKTNLTLDVTLDATDPKVTLKLTNNTGGAVNVTEALAAFNDATNDVNKFVSFANNGGKIDVNTSLSGVEFADSGNTGTSEVGFAATETTAGATTLLDAAEASTLGGSNGITAPDVIVLAENLTINDSAVVEIASGTALSSVVSLINTALEAEEIEAKATFAADVTSAGVNTITVTNNEFGSVATKFKSDKSSNLVHHLGIGTADVIIKGKDVEGTINGVNATGSGQFLKLFSTGDSADGVEVKYTGTTTSTGTLRVTVTQDSLVFQVGANTGQTVKQNIEDIRATKLGFKATGLVTTAKSVSDIDVTTVDGANDALKLIDDAIDQVTTLRGNLGAFQANVLEANIRSLGVAAENLSAAESAIRDADFADETVQFTRNQILLQAGTAILTQANAIPQAVLQLLA